MKLISPLCSVPTTSPIPMTKRTTTTHHGHWWLLSLSLSLTSNMNRITRVRQMERPDIQELRSTSSQSLVFIFFLLFPNGLVKGCLRWWWSSSAYRLGRCWMKWPIGRLAARLPIKWSNLGPGTEWVGGQGIAAAVDKIDGTKTNQAKKTELVQTKSQINK